MASRRKAAPTVEELQKALDAEKQSHSETRKWWREECEKRERLHLVMKAVAIQLAATASRSIGDIPF